MSFNNADYDAAGQPSISENMTFGVELEMLAYAPRKINPREHLTNALKKPISLRCSHCNEDHSWKLPVEGVLNSHGFVTACTTWTIHRDPSVYSEKDEEARVKRGSSQFYSLELVSRVMNFCSLTPDPVGQTYHCTGELFMWDSQTEINAFIQRIHEAFSGEGYCVATNKNCGFHIHFGNGKRQPPVKAAHGMVGVFACLERHFDQIFPASRICILPFNGLIPGIINSHSVYKYVQGDDRQSSWVGPHSRPFLETIRSSIKKAIKDNPEADRASIAGHLRDCTPEAWLDIISRCADVEALLNSWPSYDSASNHFNSRSMAVNITNFVNGSPKRTVEVRAAPGSIDSPEIWAWVEFMGKLMLWLSTPEIDHKTFILDVWANPDSTILDLVKQIGASQSTFDYYRDRLSADRTVRRHARLTSNIDKNNSFKPFLLAIERNRLNDYRIEAVNSKITQKLEGGYYGQINDALFQTLSSEIQNHPDNFLNKDTCDYELFADKIIADAANVVSSPDPYNPWNNESAQAPVWSPESFNAYLLSDVEDPFTNESDYSTPAGTSRFPRTVDGSDALADGSDDSDEFPFRMRDDDNRTFTIPPPPGGFPDTRPESPE